MRTARVPTTKMLAHRTPLQAAVMNQDLDLVRELLDNGADPNEDCFRGRKPLMHAVSTGNRAIYDLLIIRGADTNAVTKVGITAFFISTKLPDLSFALDLLTRGANINVQNIPHLNTPLHRAVIHKEAGTVRFLLAHGADPNITNKMGLTPYDIACNIGAPVEIFAALNRAVPANLAELRALHRANQRDKLRVRREKKASRVKEEEVMDEIMDD